MFKEKIDIGLVTVMLLQIFIACQSSNNIFSSNNECTSVNIYDTLSNQKVYLFVEQMPEYPGGYLALLKYLRRNFKYPKQEYFQGSFLIEFVIDIEGNLIAPRIKDKLNADLTEAEKEIIRILKKSSKWEPGVCDKKKVPVKMYFPLNL